MQNFLSLIATAWQEAALTILALGAAYGLLSRLMPCNPGQPFFHRGLLADMVYCFVMPIFSRLVRILMVSAGIGLIFYGGSPEELQRYLKEGYGPLAAMPLWVQAAVIFLLSDILLYWGHRWFHSHKLWKYHAIHHSSNPVDWTTAFRFHPVNAWLTFTLVDSLMLVAGFSPAAVGLFATFNLIYSTMVHANLNWTFGPFKTIFASPVFHRWHHTAQEEGLDKNFAPTFPLLDIVFGTYYMPEGRRPEQYGVPGSNIPNSFWKQLWWPFRQ
jgi:sterol desaturase/sphingolipid hydroxylase (fatty acid hydroxylase superfamily)